MELKDRVVLVTLAPAAASAGRPRSRSPGEGAKVGLLLDERRASHLVDVQKEIKKPLGAATAILVADVSDEGGGRAGGGRHRAAARTGGRPREQRRDLRRRGPSSRWTPSSSTGSWP